MTLSMLSMTVAIINQSKTVPTSDLWQIRLR